MSTGKPTDREMEVARKRVIAEYKKGSKPKKLSEKYGVSINTVKSWISRYKSKHPPAPAPVAPAAPSAPAPAPAPKKTGAPYGNTNAVGHGPPLGNTNALKHGGYAQVYWDTLDEEEKSLIESMDIDGEHLLVDEISLLTIRERRIMKSIAKHKEIKGEQVVSSIVRSEEKRAFANEEEQKAYEERIAEKVASGERLPGHAYRKTTTTEATHDVIHRLEEALTRCQAQKQRCIESLNKLRLARGDDGKTAPENNLLQALLAATTEDLDTDDIPELQQKTDDSDDMVESPEV